VVSRVFTAFDDWHNPSASGLCPACTWGYRAPGLRSRAHLVTEAPQLRQLTHRGLQQLLAAAVPAHVALIVPLRPGRKHLVPEARWGRVTVEDTQLSWGAADATRLAVVRRLRAAGFGPRMLTDPAPSWSVLRHLPPADRADTLRDWAALDGWRRRRPWLEVALHATTVTRTRGAGAEA
jgi:hypothetical protein